jgi:hypothetical protein
MTESSTTIKEPILDIVLKLAPFLILYCIYYFYYRDVEYVFNYAQNSDWWVKSSFFSASALVIIACCFLKYKPYTKIAVIMIIISILLPIVALYNCDKLASGDTSLWIGFFLVYFPFSMGGIGFFMSIEGINNRIHSKESN